MIEILCVGQLAADILVRPIDQVVLSGDTQLVEQIELKNGGDSMNVAVGLARLGCQVGIVGRVGDDSWGDYLASVLNREGIEARGLKRTPECGTCVVIVLISGAGERVFFYKGGANDLFSAEDVDYRLVEEASVVHVGGTYLLPRFDGKGAAELFASARSQGKLTSMDVTWDTQGRWLRTIEPCLRHLSYFLPSIREAREITGKSRPEEMAAFLQDRGVENVVIKMGSEGCYVKPFGGSGFFTPAFATQVVDTTGAGDAFVSGFLTGVLRGWDLSACARLACAVAALNIRSVGATEGMPAFQEARKFMEKETRAQ